MSGVYTVEGYDEKFAVDGNGVVYYKKEGGDWTALPKDSSEYQNILNADPGFSNYVPNEQKFTGNVLYGGKDAGVGMNAPVFNFHGGGSLGGKSLKIGGKHNFDEIYKWLKEKPLDRSISYIHPDTGEERWLNSGDILDMNFTIDIEKINRTTYNVFTSQKNKYPDQPEFLYPKGLYIEKAGNNQYNVFQSKSPGTAHVKIQGGFKSKGEAEKWMINKYDIKIWENWERG